MVKGSMNSSTGNGFGLLERNPRDPAAPTPSGYKLASRLDVRTSYRSGYWISEGSADAGAVGTASPSRGTEAPRELAGTSAALVHRSFAFVDLCGFTNFLSIHGEHGAIEALSRFRSLARDIAARRGVMVAKWLGDGAMIVGTDVGPTLATAAELIGRYDGSTLALRGGFAHGEALIIDGDDFIGRPTNLASRLCGVARPEELLAVGYLATLLPPWVTVLGTRSVTLRGLGRVRRAQRLGLVPNLELPDLSRDRPFANNAFG